MLAARQEVKRVFLILFTLDAVKSGALEHISLLCVPHTHTHTHTHTHKHVKTLSCFESFTEEQIIL